MLRSMYSAISGMLNHQIRMDVIGNNISNVNTVGFKGKRVNFADAFSQTSIQATATKPIGMTIGLGSTVTGTQTSFTQGAFQRTNVVTDLGLAGDGFFRVHSNIDTATNQVSGTGTAYYTRAGNLIIDSENFLRTSDGNYVMGFQSSEVAGAAGAGIGFATSSGDTAIASNTVAAVDPATILPVAASFTEANLRAIRIPKFIDPDNPENIDADEQSVASFSIDTDGKITLVGDGGELTAIGFVALAQFSNNDALASQANSSYQSTAGSGNPRYLPAGSGSIAEIQSGVLELSNIDIANQFADMVVTQRGFEANARTISAADEMLQTAVNLKR